MQRAAPPPSLPTYSLSSGAVDTVHCFTPKGSAFVIKGSIYIYAILGVNIIIIYLIVFLHA